MNSFPLAEKKDEAKLRKKQRTFKKFFPGNLNFHFDNSSIDTDQTL